MTTDYPKKFKLQTWRENKYRKTTNEMGRWFPGGRKRPRSLVVDDDVRVHVNVIHFACGCLFQPCWGHRIKMFAFIFVQKIAKRNYGFSISIRTVFYLSSKLYFTLIVGFFKSVDQAFEHVWFVLIWVSKRLINGCHNTTEGEDRD